ncbi:MAG TPA: hypothetical protein VLI90_00090 [Tepidisphaeraceae bacterium]|nr:hypothetical protein [Tepidisphaeraceae bacterium]
MHRCLFNLLAGVSLLLCVATAAAWADGHRHPSSTGYARPERRIHHSRGSQRDQRRGERINSTHDEEIFDNTDTQPATTAFQDLAGTISYDEGDVQVYWGDLATGFNNRWDSTMFTNPLPVYQH